MHPNGKSQLPEWILNPQPEKTTLTWKIGQAVRRNRLWRAVADAWWRFQERNRITQRYPVTTALLAWILSFIAMVVMAAIIYSLYSDVVR